MADAITSMLQAITKSSAPEFTPEDTPNTLYIPYGTNLGNIWERCEEKWPGIKMNEIDISPEYIHTHCIRYDLYDPSDYTNYLCITARKEYFERVGG